MYQKKINIIKRLRKQSPNPKEKLRLHRAEYGQDFNFKKIELDNYYPDSEELISLLAKFHKIKINQLVVGLGAESIIKDLMMHISIMIKFPKLLNFKPNYFMYSLYCKFFNIREYNIDHDPKKTKNYFLNSIFKKINKNKLNCIILVNPSSPFEINFKRSEVIKLLNFCKKKNILLILDEVYQLLGSKSSINLTEKYDNLVIIRSFSKAFGYPGLRIGYLIGNKNFIEKFESSRLAIELPSATINKGSKVLKNYRKEILPRINKILNSRSFAHKQFKKRKINSYNFNSNTVSFEFCSVESKNKVCKKMENKNILFNYNYAKPLDRFANITTTSIKNIKLFFKIFDECNN